MELLLADGVRSWHVKTDGRRRAHDLLLTSDSGMALITGRGRTLRKYTMKKDLAARKAEMIVEIGHEMLWGKDLQTLLNENVARIKDLMNKHRQFGSQIRIISVVVWSELCGDRGIEPLDQWGQRDPKEDFNQLMDRVKGNLVWWNNQLKDLGVDQAALVGEPVYGMIFTIFVERVKAWFEKDITSENERIRWIKNDKHPARLELRDFFHASESEENRSEMIGWSRFQFLHIIDI